MYKKRDRQQNKLRASAELREVQLDRKELINELREQLEREYMHECELSEIVSDHLSWTLKKLGIGLWGLHRCVCSIPYKMTDTEVLKHFDMT